MPPGVELGLHFCYGDANHRHLVEPPDTRRMVTIANRLQGALVRRVTWLHLPIPRDRDDEAYLVPLRELALATARRLVADFGVATECGFGRRPPETIPALLALHRTVAELG